MTAETITLEQLLQSYRRLSAEHQAGQLTYEQYAAALAELLGVDTAGHWWSVQPDGKFWMHDGTHWMSATPAGLVSLPVYARPADPAASQPSTPFARPTAQPHAGRPSGLRQFGPALLNLANKLAGALASKEGRPTATTAAPAAIDSVSPAVESAVQKATETPALPLPETPVTPPPLEAEVPQPPVNANPAPVEPVNEDEVITQQAPSVPPAALSAEPVDGIRIPTAQPQEAAPAPLVEKATQPRPWMMAFETGLLKGQRFPLGKQLIIGRALDSDLVLTDTQISRKHAIIAQTGEGYRITDLDSSNGTLVNGVQIKQPTALVPEDVVQVGDTRIKVLGPAGTAPLSVDEPTQRRPVSAATRAHKQRVAAVPTQVMPVQVAPAAPAASSERLCPHCGAPLKPNSRFCVKCGKPAALDAGERPAPLPEAPASELTPEAARPAPELHCPNCGEPVRVELKFCKKCGERL